MRVAEGIHDTSQEEEEKGSFIRSYNHQDTCQAQTLVALLKDCIKRKNLDRGRKIHAVIGSLKTNPFVCSTLINMYAKCGSLTEAQELFDKLPTQDVVTWSALIAGYAQHGHGEQALKCYELMQQEGFSPTEVTFVCVLKACGSMKAADKGQEIHSEIVRGGMLENNTLLGAALVDMYVKCGSLSKAQEVFDKLPLRDVVTWSALIAGFSNHGHGEEALHYFQRMQREGVSPNSVTFACILKACASMGALEKGKEIHADIVKEGLLEKDIVVGTAVVDMYAKCGSLAKAQEVFDKLPVRSIISWNVLLGGYAQHDHGQKAVNYFQCMQIEGISPDVITFLYVLKACGSVGALDVGQYLHAIIIKEGILEKDVTVGNALVDMYAKCGNLAKAQEVFDKLPFRNVVTWSTLITGYAQHGYGEQALNFFERMRLEGLPPNAVTFSCILKACGSVRAAEKGQEIHSEIVRDGLLEKDVIVGNALVDMYAKCGLVAKAQEVFDKLLVWDLVSWNSLISGYCQYGHGEQALKCFDRMQQEGISPNRITYTCILKACGNTGAADKGQEIHAEIARGGLVEKEIVVGNALVAMYAKCGLVARAQDVFDRLPARDAVTWGTLIEGYALLGQTDHVFYLLDTMIVEAIKPDLVTFTVVLNACRHAGLLDKGQLYFETISNIYGFVPTLEHYTCMVDLYARAGHLEKAVELIKEMPFSANLTVWNIVLGACRKWGNMKLGRLAFEHAVQFDEKDAAAYVCMGNIYADAGRQGDADKVEAMRV